MMSMKLAGLSSGEVTHAMNTTATIKAALTPTGAHFNVMHNVVINTVTTGEMRECVRASADRGRFIATLLPNDRWSVMSYTWNNYFHTFNVVSFRDKNDTVHYWKVDTYYHAIPEVSYLGTQDPAEPGWFKFGWHLNTFDLQTTQGDGDFSAWRTANAWWTPVDRTYVTPAGNLLNKIGTGLKNTWSNWEKQAEIRQEQYSEECRRRYEAGEWGDPSTGHYVWAAI